MLAEPAAKTEAENHTLSSSAEAAEIAEAVLGSEKGTVLLSFAARRDPVLIVRGPKSRPARV